MVFQRAAALDDLWDGEMRGVEINGQRILLVNWGGEIRAYEDRCPHLSVPLSEGRLEGPVLQCRAHHWEFNIQTGRGVNPVSSRMMTLPVKVDHQNIWVDVEPAS